MKTHIEAAEQRLLTECAGSGDTSRAVCAAAINLAIAHLETLAGEELLASLRRDAHVSADCLDRPYEQHRSAICTLANVESVYWTDKAGRQELHT